MALPLCFKQRAKKGIFKVSAKCNVIRAKTRFVKAPATCNRKIIPLGTSHVKFFGIVTWFQYLIEGLKSISDKVAPESKSFMCTDIFRI